MLHKKALGFVVLVGTLGVGLSLNQGCVSPSQNSHKLEVVRNSGTGGFSQSAVRSPAEVGRTKYPWEVYGPHGETLLPNLYYSELSDNEQVMPLMVNDRYYIDRVVYPTLGHPNLVFKSDPTDRLTVVLRLEPDAFSGKVAPATGLDNDEQQYMDALDTTSTKPSKTLQFFLVDRKKGRALLEDINTPMVANAKVGIVQIQPSAIFIDKISKSKMPAKFQERSTLRVQFSAATLANVTPGFYDLRFQSVDSGGNLTKIGSMPIAEFQYNSVRVFLDTTPAKNAKGKAPISSDHYRILNITDAQVSGGLAYSKITVDKLEEFKNYLNKNNANDSILNRFAFITFNGDLHNGGSPAGFSSKFVATSYNAEAHQTTAVLKDLPLPIFLTTGNHDGYAGTTAVPSGIEKWEEIHGVFGKIPLQPGEVDDFVREKAGNWSAKAHNDINNLIWGPGGKSGNSSAGSSVAQKFHDTDFEAQTGEPMIDVVRREAINSGRSTWPALTEEMFLADQKKIRDNPTDNPPGGRPQNIYSGSHVRLLPMTTAGNGDQWLDDAWDSWKEVPQTDRNMILFDGVHQWQKTYGPTYYSWTFGSNHYVSMNSFEIRQHRRTGWGMYTVNYGGGISQVQLDWIRRDLDNNSEKDLILLAHHDPRGGHNGKDFPYYFKQIDFTGMKTSAFNYVQGEYVDKNLCKPNSGIDPKTAAAVTGADDETFKLGCLHDGLQEWMRPDPLFDCVQRAGIFEEVGQNPKSPHWVCNEENIKKAVDYNPRYYSGYEMISLIAAGRQDASGNWHPYNNLRTILLGHTHYNNLEILHEDEDLIPRTVKLDPATEATRGKLEVINPLRAYTADIDNAKKAAASSGAAVDQGAASVAGGASGPSAGQQQPVLATDQTNGQPNSGFITTATTPDGEERTLHLERFYPALQFKISGPPTRELAILRMTSVSKLTSQSIGSASIGDQNGKNGLNMYGYTAFSIYKSNQPNDNRNYALPQINSVYYFRNLEQGNNFTLVSGVPIILDRTAKLHNTDPESSKPIVKHGMVMPQ